MYTAVAKRLLSETHFTFSRSSGPGGQKVNKTNSQAELRWSMALNETLAPSQKDRILKHLKNRINGDLELVIACDVHRSKNQNIEECKNRFVDLIAKALHVPKKRKPTKPTRSSKEKRLESKKQHSQTKGLRKKPSINN